MMSATTSSDSGNLRNDSALNNDDYTIGWISALGFEVIAARLLLDQEHPSLPQADDDTNTYLLGGIGRHNVVVTWLPAGSIGTNAAAAVAKDMMRSFPRLRVVLLVGIGGGAPSKPEELPENDIHLGDVVVSCPTGKYGGVLQYDFGKTCQDGDFHHVGTLDKPPAAIRSCMTKLQVNHGMEQSRIPGILQRVFESNVKTSITFKYPGCDRDRLFQSEYVHDKGKKNCLDCDQSRLVERLPRNGEAPMVHYGIIASGNQVMKDSKTRDSLRDKYDILCFEMEAAGLMDNCPCLVIRGIADYSDSHKQDDWQRYAALTAAAYAYELLHLVPKSSVVSEKPIQIVSDPETHNLLKRSIAVQQETRDESRKRSKHTETQFRNESERECLQVFKTCAYEQFKNINPDRVEGTCRWVLDDSRFQEWRKSRSNSLLWVSADPGCGKSVLSKSLVDVDFKDSHEQIVCYFFFKDNQHQESLPSALCSLLHQLFSSQRQLLSHAIPPWERNKEKLCHEIYELWRLLTAAAADSPKPVICVLDALDECNSRDCELLIRFLCDFYAESTCKRIPSGTLKFIVTARPYLSIEHSFWESCRSFPQIRLRGEDKNEQINQEINLVIQKLVAELALRFKLSQEIEEKLTASLLEMENRTYLWLYLTIKEIREIYTTSPYPNREPFPKISPSVEAAYEHILSKVKESQRSTVRQILLIIGGAARPLTIKELSIALGVTKSFIDKVYNIRFDEVYIEEKIRPLCGLFVFVSHSYVYLIHQTAKKFLLTDDATDQGSTSSKWKHCMTRNDAEKRMARICLGYMNWLEQCAESDRFDLRRHFQCRTEHKCCVEDPALGICNPSLLKFMEYTVKYWPEHLRLASLDDDEALWHNCLALYSPNSQLSNVWHSLWYLRHSRVSHGDLGKPSYLKIAAHLGHLNVLQKLKKLENFKVNIKNYGQDLLAWAIDQDRFPVVEWLLEKGASILSMDFPHALVTRDVPETWDPNQEHWPDPNAEGFNWSDAIIQASCQGYFEIVQLLLKHGADVNAQGGIYGNALQAASFRGSIEIVKLLLKHGANVNAQGGKFGNAFQAASFRRGSIEKVQLLLKHGADVNAQGGEYGNALQASCRGFIEKVQLLLEHGADVNAQGGKKYGNALQAASASLGSIEKVQLLLEHGADVNAQGGKYSNAIKAASLYGFIEIVQLLLEHGADRNAQDRFAVFSRPFQEHEANDSLEVEYSEDSESSEIF